MSMDYIRRARERRGFLSHEDVGETIGQRNDVLDSSVLISSRVIVGKNNTIYPNVIIECGEGGEVAIGDGNIFYPGTHIVCSMGSVAIGNANEFGPAGVTIRANAPHAYIMIGDGGRYCDGASIMGATMLGSGSQVLGNITVQSCSLADGEAYGYPDPDERAGVLKGFGLARNIALGVGQVVNGAGDFTDSPVEWQRNYHPKPKQDN